MSAVGTVTDAAVLSGAQEIIVPTGSAAANIAVTRVFIRATYHRPVGKPMEILSGGARVSRRSMTISEERM